MIITILAEPRSESTNTSFIKEKTDYFNQLKIKIKEKHLS
jgi:hypothetical protein